MKLSPSTAERIEKSAEVFCESLEGESEYLTAVVHYKAGATAEAVRAEKLAEALEKILGEFELSLSDLTPGVKGKALVVEAAIARREYDVAIAKSALKAYREGKDV